jgi:diacylglycerol kinase family enzyme
VASDHPRPRRIAAIINSEAGPARAAGLDAESLCRLFQEAGVEADVHLIPGAQIETAARAALAAGAEVLVAGGGDGTIRSVAGVLAGGNVPLGVLPVGTLNHFARDLGIPADIPAAVRLIAAGTPRALDLGEVNGEIFVNNSMLGFYPPVVEVRDRELRQKERNKWIATISATLKVLPRHRLLQVRVTAEGLTVDHQTRFLFVGNNEYEMSAFTYGARRFDSEGLFLYIAKSRTRLGLIGLGLLGLFRDLAWTDRFDRFCLPEFTIETRKNVERVYLDGEVVPLKPPLRYRNRPHALRVIVPAEAETKE